MNKEERRIDESTGVHSGNEVEEFDNTGSGDDDIGVGVDIVLVPETR